MYNVLFQWLEMWLQLSLIYLLICLVLPKSLKAAATSCPLRVLLSTLLGLWPHVRLLLLPVDTLLVPPSLPYLVLGCFLPMQALSLGLGSLSLTGTRNPRTSWPPPTAWVATLLNFNRWLSHSKERKEDEEEEEKLHFLSNKEKILLECIKYI